MKRYLVKIEVYVSGDLIGLEVEGNAEKIPSRKLLKKEITKLMEAKLKMKLKKLKIVSVVEIGYKVVDKFNIEIKVMS